MAVQDIDHGWNAIFNGARTLSRNAITVGIHEDAPPEADGTDLVSVATINEFGATNKQGGVIPARPFIRTTADLYEVSLGGIVQDAFGHVLGGGPVSQMLTTVGAWYQARTKDTLMQVAVRWKPNAPSTIRKKGFDWPLVHTLTLWRNIAYKIVRTP